MILTFALVPVAPAAAVPPDHFTFDETSSLSFVGCGGEQTTAVIHECGNGLIGFQRDGQAYLWVKYEGHVALTRTSTGKTVNLYADFINRDAKITDNGEARSPSWRARSSTSVTTHQTGRSGCARSARRQPSS